MEGMKEGRKKGRPKGVTKEERRKGGMKKR